jgi:hypothetical protein
MPTVSSALSTQHSAPSTVSDFIVLMKPGVMSLVVFTGLALFCNSPAFAKAPTCVMTDRLSLLENLQKSDAIAEVRHAPKKWVQRPGGVTEEKWIKDGDSYSDEFQIVQVIYGKALAPGQPIRVWWTQQKPSLQSKNHNSRQNFRFDSLAPVENNPEDKDRSAHFFLKKWKRTIVFWLIFISLKLLH